MLDIILNELGYKHKDFKEYLALMIQNPKLKPRFNAFKEYFEEYLGTSSLS